MEYSEHVKKKSKNDNSTNTLPAWFCLPTLLQVLKKNSLHDLYQNVYEIIKIVTSLPVTVASCERAYSKVKIVNNYLHTSMPDIMLESFVQISNNMIWQRG